MKPPKSAKENNNNTIVDNSKELVDSIPNAITIKGQGSTIVHKDYKCSSFRIPKCSKKANVLKNVFLNV